MRIRANENERAVGLNTGASVHTTSMRPGSPATLHPGLITAFAPDDPISLQMRALRAIIQQSFGGRRPGAVASCAMIGIDCESDLALLAGNLAIATAQLGTGTLLIDADFDEPSLHALFGLPNETGLMDHIDESAETVAALPTSIAGLSVMPAGPQHKRAGHLLERGALLDLLEQLPLSAQQFLVSIPLRREATRSIAHLLRGFHCTVLVAKRDVTAIGHLRQMIDALDERSVPLLGTIIL